jgi:hypothetical protein
MPALYRYDRPEISDRILKGSIRVSTLEACRKAENPAARDVDEGTKTITSLAGTNYPSVQDFAKMLGVNPASIAMTPNAVKLVSENAIHRTEMLKDAFLLCLSTLENDPMMMTKFGKGCIKIRDAEEFCRLLDQHLRAKFPAGALSGCIVDAVEYSPRTNNYLDHTDKHPAFLKPAGAPGFFDSECEVRAIWIPRGIAPAPVTMTIPEVVPLLERVN